MMTPQEYSTPLIGGSVDPGTIYQSIRNAWRDWQARRIHQRVMRELEARTLEQSCREEETK